jgi:hypothetical protein
MARTRRRELSSDQRWLLNFYVGSKIRLKIPSARAWFLGYARSPDPKPANQARPAKARAHILQARTGPTSAVHSFIYFLVRTPLLSEGQVTPNTVHSFIWFDHLAHLLTLGSRSCAHFEPCFPPAGSAHAKPAGSVGSPAAPRKDFPGSSFPSPSGSNPGPRKLHPAVAEAARRPLPPGLPKNSPGMASNINTFTYGRAKTCFTYSNIFSYMYVYMGKYQTCVFCPLG